MKATADFYPTFTDQILVTGCDECGEGDDKLAYTCNYCSGSYCSQHRLPEKH